MLESEPVTELIDMDNRTWEGIWEKSQKTPIFKIGLPREGQKTERLERKRNARNVQGHRKLQDSRREGISALVPAEATF